ncbi:PadR family transcriptional regulator [Leucobacter sp. wl10]|nr:PadR family transcriptional regulator [Leucobacter sp. wl10]
MDYDLVMKSDSSSSDWSRAAMLLLLLHHLSRAPNHGYGLMDLLRAQGFDVKGATVYPQLSKLQGEGLIRSEWHAPESGPARKVMTITPAGEARLSELLQHWASFQDRLDAALGRNITEGEAR